VPLAQHGSRADFAVNLDTNPLTIMKRGLRPPRGCPDTADRSALYVVIRPPIAT
jgi:hypothetical protein